MQICQTNEPFLASTVK